jgi:hypothetical protein
MDYEGEEFLQRVFWFERHPVYLSMGAPQNSCYEFG